ncbi:MAG: TetR/AcrR family transcriptional regulator [Anaerolineaceae bacterium]|nr:TetR/AcrR family transcriptional regulator [Anaerolineaceae bacterium]
MNRTLQPEKRERFLQVALKLFARNGIKQTSTAAIAREAGTAAGTLFLYFPTKQDLINELLLQIAREQSEYIQSRLNPEVSVQEAFFTIWQGSIIWFLEHPNTYAFVQQTRHPRTVDPLIVKKSEQYFSYYYKTIQRGLNEKCIKDYPLDLVGGLLYQDIVAVMDLILGTNGDQKQSHYIQTGFNIFWDGIKSFTATKPDP